MINAKFSQSPGHAGLLSRHPAHCDYAQHRLREQSERKSQNLPKPQWNAVEVVTRGHRGVAWGRSLAVSGCSSVPLQVSCLVWRQTLTVKGGRHHGEADLSAQQSPSRSDSRVPRAYAHSRGPGHSCCSSPQGTHRAVSLRHRAAGL